MTENSIANIAETNMERRTVLKGIIATGLPTIANARSTATDAERPWQTTWNAALATLAANVHLAPKFDQPVLFEGPKFRGIWQECGPHEALAYAKLAAHIKGGGATATPLEIARNSHRIFFTNQRADGQLPAYLNLWSGVNFGQIQMVVPIAATAWETAQMLNDEAFLLEAYTACARWDEWIRTYRDTRKTGLVEAFCTFDTGQDNSPRWSGVADECPNQDAKTFQPHPTMPRLCPDLSATVFGARVALSAMARALGKQAEARVWNQRAQTIRKLIIERLWCAEDSSFYDVAPDGSFVRIRSVANLRVLGEHVLRLDNRQERRMFEALWARQLSNPRAYWTPYPFPSIALDDKSFVRPIPFNSWGGASQALTALRTLRWMDHFGKAKAQDELAMRWCEAIFRGGFGQQVDPVSGEMTKSPIKDYSPSALAFLHFAKRLKKAPGGYEGASATGLIAQTTPR